MIALQLQAIPRKASSRLSSRSPFRILALVALAGFLVIASAPPASACSVAGIPDARQLAARAETVALVRVVGNEVRGRSAVPVLKVVESFKGPTAGETFTVGGRVEYREPPDTEPVTFYPDHTPPYDSHPESRRLAACYPSEVYVLHGHYLLFLRNGTFRWAGLAATNVRVGGADDPWVAWVRQFFRDTL